MHSQSNTDRTTFTRREWLTLLACILGSSAAFLDGTIVNVALPAIRSSLHGGLGTQEWVVDAYLLTLGSLLLTGGSLGDLYGRRRVFAIGISGFGIASLVCAAAPDPAALITARAIQGIAAALLVPSNLALIVDVFPERRRGAAIGVWSAWTGIATVAGPLLGGLLVQVASWRWVFVINAPLTLVTLALILRIPATPRRGGRVDWLGGMLGAGGLAGPIFALIEQPTYGWADTRVWATLVAGCVLMTTFVWWEQRAPAPMLPFSMFRSRNFSVSNLTTFTLYGALSVTTFFLTVFLQQVGGYRPLEAGLSMLPVSILVFLIAKRAGALADRIGPRLFMGLGPMCAGAGLLLLLRVGAHPAYVRDVLPVAVLLGLGMGVTIAPLTATVLAGAPSTHSGIASGINNAVSRVAGLVAIAVVGAVVAGQFSTRVEQLLTLPHSTPAYHAAVQQAAQATLQTRVPVAVAHAYGPAAHQVLRDASVHAFHVAAWLAGLLALLSGVLNLIGISNRPNEALSDLGQRLLRGVKPAKDEPVGPVPDRGTL